MMINVGVSWKENIRKSYDYFPTHPEHAKQKQKMFRRFQPDKSVLHWGGFALGQERRPGGGLKGTPRESDLFA